MSLLSDQLWDSAEEIRQRILKTAFIQGLKDGSLDPVKFGNYVIQDLVFCYRVKKAIDTVAARSFGDIRDFMKTQVLYNQQNVERLMKDWSIQNPDGVYVNYACKAYIDFFTHIGESYDPVYFLVALLPCTRLWPWLGEQLRQSESWPDVHRRNSSFFYSLLSLAGPDYFTFGKAIVKVMLVVDEDYSGVYQSWVNEHFRDVIPRQWEDIIDKSTDIDRELAQKIYTESMKDELEFFNSVFNVK